MRELAHALRQREREGLYRRRTVSETPQGAHITVDGRTYLAFCSNDYLGLAAEPRVIEALQRGAARYGAGSGAAHLVCGHSRAHHLLEEELADFVGRPRALLFSTGYMANLGAVTSLLHRGDAVFEDRLNHASLLDAGLLSGARMRRYRHADVSALATLLAKSTAPRRLVVTDGVFSMDGDVAPLPELAQICRQNDAWLMVDDAHGLGVLGPNGGGTVAEWGLSDEDVPILVGTLGKAFGTFGAFVAGDGVLIETLIQQARSYIYTTALPPAVAEATRAALNIVREEQWRRRHLASLIARFGQGAQALGLPLLRSTTPIQPLVVGQAEQAVNLSAALRERGLLVPAIRPPTVPQGVSRLRITLSAAHTEAHIDRLLEALAELAPHSGAEAQ